MSHVTKLKTVIKARDLGTLRRACLKLGIEFMEDQTTFRSYAENQRCTHAIRVPGARYEIGICEEEDGNFSVQLDDYEPGGLADKLGHGGQKLMDRFSAEKVIATAADEGYDIVETYDEETDEIVLMLDR